MTVKDNYSCVEYILGSYLNSFNFPPINHHKWVFEQDTRFLLCRFLCRFFIALMAFISFLQKYHFLTNRLAWIFLRSTQPRSQNTVISVGGASVFYQRSPDPLVLLNLHIFPVGFIVKGFIIRDLSEISRWGGEIR